MWYENTALPQKTIPPLSMALLLTLYAPTVLHAATQTDNTAELAHILVTAPAKTYPDAVINRKVNVGILGTVDYMDNPYNVTSYSNEALNKQQIRSMLGLLDKYDASINALGSDTYGVDLFSIRGLYVSPTGTSINGLAGMAGFQKIPINGIDTIQVTKGPAAMLKGAATANAGGGDVNLTTKRADNAPLSEFGLSYYSRNRPGFNTDIGRRFGSNHEWGVRFNSDFRQGDGVRQKQTEKTTLTFLGLDYRGDRIRASLDLMANNYNPTANRGIILSHPSKALPNIDGQLPKAPKGTINFDQRFAKQKARDRTVIARIEADLSEDITAYGTVGFSKSILKVANAANWFSTKAIDPNAEFGSIHPGNLSNYHANRKTLSSEVGITGTQTLGNTKHQWAVATNLSQAKHLGGTSFYPLPRSCHRSTIYQVHDCDFNLDDHMPAQSFSFPARNKLTSLAIVDTVAFWDGKLLTTLGIRQQAITSTSSARKIRQTATSPTLGLVFRPVPDLAFYGNYIEALNQGQAAPNEAANAGELTPPSKTKQIELGVKKDFGAWTASSALFQLEQASGLLNPDTLIYANNGKRQNRGLELNLFGEPIEGLRVTASVSGIKSKRLAYDKRAFGSNSVFPLPKFTSKLNAEWDIPQTKQLTLSGSVIHTGSAKVDGHDFYTAALTTTRIPSWTRIDLGLAATLDNILGKETKLLFSVENAFNRRYWQLGDYNGNNITALDHAAPRTFLLSLKTKF